MACRLNHAQDWSTRLLCEHTYNQKAAFVTLTYMDSKLPVNHYYDKVNKKNVLIPTLRKKDIQLWLKRLRKQFPERKIKYYLAGEYGEKEQRPHYHAIMFGLSINELKTIGYMSWNKCTLKNFVVDVVCPETINYVTKYIIDKDKGYTAAESYKHREAPSALISNGIGLEYCYRHADELRRNLSLMGPGGTIRPIPRYFRKVLNISGSEFPDLNDEDLEKKQKKYQSREQREKNQISRKNLKGRQIL